MSDQREVLVCEAGLRDGLQLVKGVLATVAKTELLDALVAAGVRETDTTSFVPAHVIPQFADAAEVMAHARTHKGLRAGALIPNVKGAERAIAAGAQVLYYVTSVSRSHNLANVRRTPEQSIAALKEVKARIDALDSAARPGLVGALSTSFGCSIEGRIRPRDVCALAVEMREVGVEEIVLADTVGYADPALIRSVVADVKGAVGRGFRLRLHLHDTMGLALANTLAGLEAGIRRFDSAIGGLGGCPFAPGASGNVASEDLVFMLEQMGLKTGIDLARLLEATEMLARALPNERIRSHLREARIPKVYHVAA